MNDAEKHSARSAKSTSQSSLSILQDALELAEQTDA